MTGKQQPVRAAIYVRVSTEEQVDGTSLDSQREACRAYCATHSWQVVHEFADEGVSGAKSDRPQWRAMLAAARSGTIDAVVVTKMDRFSRNAGHAIAEMDLLVQLGVIFVSVREGIDLSTAHGRMMRTMLAGFAELERDTITERSVGGQRAKARQGRWPGGEPPFGWRLEGEKRLVRVVPDEREREVIGLAYRWLAQDGRSATEIADALNAAGLRPRRAPRWEYTLVRRVFGNETLCTGQVVWGRPNGETGRSHHTRLNADGRPKHGEPIVLELPDPPVTRDAWIAARRALTGAVRPEAPTSQPPRAHPLSGRLMSPCGRHYTGITLTARNRVIYRCDGRRHRASDVPKCSCPQLQALAIEERVWSEVVGLLGEPTRLVTMAREWMARGTGGAPGDTDDELAAKVERQVARLEAARAKATRELLFTDDDEELRKQLSSVTEELRIARDRQRSLELLQAQASERGRQLEDLAELTRAAAHRLGDLPPAGQREVLTLLDVRVRIVDLADRREPSLHIEGRVDPRVFGEEDGFSDAVPPPADPDLDHQTRPMCVPPFGFSIAG